MKKLSIVLIIILGLILSACNQDEEFENSNNDNDDVIKPIDVELDAPEQIDANESIVFSATVTQDNEPVEDASEVEFEVWKDGLKDDSEMIEASHEGDGIYTIEKTFSEDGLYFVQSHVSAREMHAMPQAEVKVGNAETTEAVGEEEEDSTHSHSQVTIELQQPEEITSGETLDFTAKVLQEEQALESANVTLEVWHEDTEDHDWINTSENKSGHYDAKVTFQQNTQYIVNVHVENENVHDHKEFTVEAK